MKLAKYSKTERKYEKVKEIYKCKKKIIKNKGILHLFNFFKGL